MGLQRFTLLSSSALSAVLLASSPSPRVANFLHAKLYFEPNVGQLPEGVRFVARGANNTLLTSDGLVFDTLANAVHFVGSSRNPRIEELERDSGYSNYYIGGNPAKWHLAVPHLARLRYLGLYPGIDLIYHSQDADLEYDYVISPGADPGRIKFTVPFASSINDDGSLTVGPSTPEIRLHRPSAYQVDGAKHVSVACSFVIASDGSIGFSLGPFERTKVLVIDPVITFSTLFGGSQGDSVASMSVDQAGNAYVIGSTVSNFPVTTGASPSSVFISKFAPNGSLVYSTFFGGTGPVAASSTSLDAAGNLYVVGITSSSSFPTTAGAFNRTVVCNIYGTLGSDGFSAKFSPSGSLIYSTLLGQCTVFFAGGSEVRSITAVTDAAGEVFAGVNLLSPHFVMSSATLVEVNSSGSIVSQISMLDLAFHTSALAIDSTGFLYLAGTLGQSQVVVMKMSSVGSLVYTTTLGTGSPSGIAVDALGQAYVTGATQNGIPLTPGSYQNGTTGSFITKVAASGNTVLYTALLAGGQSNAISVDASGRCYVAGSASSSLPIANATQPKFGGGASDAFLFELSQDGTTPLFSTFLGGSQNDSVISVAIGADGSIYVAGNTSSPDFPRTSAIGALGGGDVFVVRFTPGTVSVLTTSVSFNLAAGSQPAATALQVSGSLPSLSFTASVSANTGWLSVSPTSGVTPATLSVVANSGNLPVGIYNGTITVTGVGGATGEATIDVSLTLSAPFPTITSVVNAASFQRGPASPGEIVTIDGTAIGPSSPAYLTLDQNGKVSTLVGGVQVLFSGFPAPLTYVSSTQINAVVPYEIQGLLSPSVEVQYQGQTSNAFSLTATSAAPALFTFNGSGTGPAAALNQDQSYNAPNNPAPKGSYVVLYMTGEGQTAPQGVTGEVTAVSAIPPLTPQPILPVVVLINGEGAYVAFYGEAPGLVSGVMQLNVQVPADAASGNLPISVSIGGNSSPSGVTISVE